MKRGHLLGQFIGVIVMGSVLFVALWRNEHSQNERSNVNVAIGRNISEISIHPLDSTNGLISTKAHKFFYILVSPDCEHCQSILNLLKEDTTLLCVETTPVKLVFGRNYNDAQIHDFMKLNKFDFVVYKSETPSILDNFKAFPTFIYVQADRIKQVHTGGVSTIADLKKLLRLMENPQWKQKQSSASQSACSS